MAHETTIWCVSYKKPAEITPGRMDIQQGRRVSEEETFLSRRSERLKGVSKQYFFFVCYFKFQNEKRMWNVFPIKDNENFKVATGKIQLNFTNYCKTCAVKWFFE